MNFTNLIEAAEWLGKEEECIKIKRMQKLVENKKFFLTVWGHYSAGKSKLINNILERDLLPVQVRETTAALTYIYYGIDEKCIVIYEDGVSEEYELGVLKEVFQNNTKFPKLEEIDHIEVYINNELLKTGLVFVDTPGVNTVIQKHLNLAVNAIEQSGRILYVLGNAPTNIDKQFIKQIADCGIKISFIRTKCDRFNEMEENVEYALTKEKEDIFSFTGNNTEYIPVSNEKESEWFRNINEIRKLLGQISEKLSDELKQITKERRKIFLHQYEIELSQEEQRLISMIDGNTQSLNQEIEICDRELRSLQSLEADLEKRIEGKVKQAKIESNKEIDELITKRYKVFAKKLENSELKYGDKEKVEKLCSDQIVETVERFQKLLNGYFETIIKEEIENIKDCVTQDIYLNSAPTYTEVEQLNSEILEFYNNRLSEIKSTIQSIMEARKQNEVELSDTLKEWNEEDFMEAIAQLDQKLAEIPSETIFRLSENQNIQPSQIFKKIGIAADMLLLILPGNAISTGVKAMVNTNKLAKTIGKMGKAGEIIVKAGSTIVNNSNKINTGWDWLYTLKRTMKIEDYHREERFVKNMVDNVALKAQDTFESYKGRKSVGDVLDAFTVSYWTEKIGKKFDRAPKMEIDTVQEALKTKTKKIIMQEQQKLSNERIQYQKKVGLLNEKENELKMRQQEAEEIQKNVENDLIKQEKILYEQACKNAFEKYINDYKQYYRDYITSAGNDMMEQYFRCVNQNITMYIANQNADVMRKIEDKKYQIDQLIEMKERGNEELENRLEQCRILLNKMENDE